jgi:chitinase
MKKILLLIVTVIYAPYLFGQSFKIVAYLPDYRWSNLHSIDFSKTTHALAAFGNPDSSGTLSFSQDIDAFASAVHSGGAKALISIGGGADYSWGNEYHTYEYLFTNTNRTPFIGKIMDYVRLHQLDGIDLDIEGFALQLVNYNLFAQELADSLHMTGRIICGAYVGGYWASFLSSATIGKLDFMTTQSYGGVDNSNWNSPGDPAPFSLFQNDITFWKSKGFHADQVLGGLPFFAVEFPPAIQSVYWPYEPTLCSVYTGAQYTGQHPLQNDLVHGYNGDPVYLNSLNTFKKKVNYAAANAGGIMIWEIGGDCYNGTINILDSLYHYSTITSVKEKQASDVVKFYPNPANDLIKIDGLSALVKSCTIEDIFGREVLTIVLLDSFIDVSKLNPGMYFMNFYEEESHHNPVPLMIQR